MVELLARRERIPFLLGHHWVCSGDWSFHRTVRSREPRATSVGENWEASLQFFAWYDRTGMGRSGGCGGTNFSLRRHDGTDLR
jgi:hypothetical protein